MVCTDQTIRICKETCDIRKRLGRGNWVGKVSESIGQLSGEFLLLGVTVLVRAVPIFYV